MINKCNYFLRDLTRTCGIIALILTVQVVAVYGDELTFSEQFMFGLFLGSLVSGYFAVSDPWLRYTKWGLR
jgi:hypothetical protein